MRNLGRQRSESGVSDGCGTCAHAKHEGRDEGESERDGIGKEGDERKEAWKLSREKFGERSKAAGC